MEEENMSCEDDKGNITAKVDVPNEDRIGQDDHIWTEERTLTFIRLRKANNQRFLKKKNYARIGWMRIVKQMKLDDTVTIGDCARKWADLCRTYEEIKERRDDDQATAWPYYEAMETQGTDTKGSLESLVNSAQDVINASHSYRMSNASNSNHTATPSKKRRLSSPEHEQGSNCREMMNTINLLLETVREQSRHIHQQNEKLTNLLAGFIDHYIRT